jgi:hypothetical protein
VDAIGAAIQALFNADGDGWQVGQCLGGGDKQKRSGIGVDGGLNLPGL